MADRTKNLLREPNNLHSVPRDPSDFDIKRRHASEESLEPPARPKKSRRRHSKRFRIAEASETGTAGTAGTAKAVPPKAVPPTTTKAPTSGTSTAPKTAPPVETQAFSEPRFTEVDKRRLIESGRALYGSLPSWVTKCRKTHLHQALSLFIKRVTDGPETHGLENVAGSGDSFYALFKSGKHRMTALKRVHGTTLTVDGKEAELVVRIFGDFDGQITATCLRLCDMADISPSQVLAIGDLLPRQGLKRHGHGE